jgi:hypothetical protein
MSRAVARRALDPTHTQSAVTLREALVDPEAVLARFQPLGAGDRRNRRTVAWPYSGWDHGRNA